MFASAPTPNLIILETKANAASLLSELAPLAAVCDPSTKVVIIGYYNDIALYRELIRNGISEYMVAADRDAGRHDGHGVDFRRPGCRAAWPQHCLHRHPREAPVPPTIAHNCAFGISNLFSTETILADLDLPYGTANIDFDQDPTQGIAEAVFAPDRLDEVFLDRLLTKCSEHLSLLAAPSTTRSRLRFPMAMHFSRSLKSCSAARRSTVLDVPHAWIGMDALGPGCRADEVVIVRRSPESREPAQRKEHARCADASCARTTSCRHD